VRVLYRLRQFWHTLFGKPTPLELERVRALLSPPQAELFELLQPAEKAHAKVVAYTLMERGENHPDLLVAALLHDVGKLRYRLNPMERTAIVLLKAIKPGLAQRLGVLPPGGWAGLPGWRKAFILAEHHAMWGAEMARQAGVSPLAETLIREHHHPHTAGVVDVESDLLQKLWVVDNDS
jgi:putative nucleotidyltransferase with HDIG domain